MKISLFNQKILAFYATLFYLSPTWSASFDCAKASSKIEKMICTDSVVSNLDERLAEKYKIMISEAAQPNLVKQSQKTWLKQTRAHCNSSQCLAKVYENRIAELDSVKRFSWKTFHDTNLKIKLVYPDNKSVKVISGEKKFIIFDPSGKKVGENEKQIEFEMYHGDFEEIAKKTSAFEKTDGIWYLSYGRFMPPEGD